MSDAKLWINDADSTATIAGTNVSYTMPLWVFDVMRDIIEVEAEKKVEVTYRDFDTQQELLDRYRAENARLRELVCHLYYVKPRDVTSILVNGEILDFDELMAEVGLKWEDA